MKTVTDVRFRLGYWMSEKKRRKFIHTEFSNMCRSSGIDLVEIDLNQPLEEQGPFSAILHKLTDIIVKAEAVGEIQVETKEMMENKKIIQAIEQYLSVHPEILVIDPIDNVRLLLDRSKTYRLIEESLLAKQGVVFTPAFVELNKMDSVENLSLLKQAGVNFPFICKPSVAHGSRLAHQMSIIFNEKGIETITPPCVAQSFICHNAVLYKLFAVGDKWFQVERPSLKNFYSGDHETIFFDSQNVSKATADSLLNQLDQDDLHHPVHKPSVAIFQEIMATVHKNLGMTLFGVDVVIENSSGKYAIIDINAFPGYDGVPEFYKTLIDYIIEQMNKREIAKCNGSFLASEQEDSGIDTGYSSDEKQNKKCVKLNRRQHPRSCQHSLS